MIRKFRSSQDKRTTQKAESEDHVFQRLVSQGRKRNVDDIQALVSCHTYPDGVSSIQHTAAKIIRQSVDSEFHSIFELSHTWSSTINVQASMYLKALIIKHYKLSPSASIIQSRRIDEVIASNGNLEKAAKIKTSIFSNLRPTCNKTRVFMKRYSSFQVYPRLESSRCTRH